MDQKEFENLLKEQKVKRREVTNKILSSASIKKVIVSGPGTGKTFTFQELLKTKQGNYLALTFINNLAKKLENDLGDTAKTSTFHSFCKELLHSIKKTDLTDEFILFPDLELIVQSDAELFFNLKPKFMQSFRKIDLSHNYIKFFLERSSYYNAVSFDDSVYRVLDYFRNNPDQIPSYDQIVVDEYQDFNMLEVEFINILASKSPILIVGDDDQALYGALKSASAKYIRDKYKSSEYDDFSLPFCSRCTLVVTKAVKDIISRASVQGKLKERVPKEYVCYLPDKWDDSKKYPKIIHARCSVQRKKFPSAAFFIESEIDKLSPDDVKAANVKGDYTVLVTGSKQYLRQLIEYFKKQGKYDLFYRKEEDFSKSLKIIDGYKILFEKGISNNFGWRILLEHNRPKNIKSILSKTKKDTTVKLLDALPKDYTDKHIKIINLLKELLIGGQLTSAGRSILEKSLKMKIDKIVDYMGKDRSKAKQSSFPQDVNKISIVFSTYVGCKGLSVGYVFIVGLDEGNLPKKNNTPTELEIRKFIVALTRTIKKCYLISIGNFSGQWLKQSIFINWVSSKRLDSVSVNKAYFENG